MKKREFFKHLGILNILCAVGVMAAATVWAQQDYPKQPIRLIVSYPPGGTLDTIARSVGTEISKTLGQQVVVDNRPGAGGNIGLQLAANSPPDGYTVVVGSTAALSINPYTYKKLSFDARKDFIAVAMIGTIQSVLVVEKNVPVNNFAEFVAYLKAHPGQINFASPGNGHTSHLIGEMFKQRTGVDIQHVPYKGDVPAFTDLIGGQVQMMFATVLAASPHIKSGALKALAIAGPNRSIVIPSVPTMQEVGIDNVDGDAWIGIVAPVGTPLAIVARLNQEINAALASAEVSARLTGLGLRLAPMSVSAFDELMQRESDKWGQLVKHANITLD